MVQSLCSEGTLVSFTITTSTGAIGSHQTVCSKNGWHEQWGVCGGGAEAEPVYWQDN